MSERQGAIFVRASDRLAWKIQGNLTWADVLILCDLLHEQAIKELRGAGVVGGLDARLPPFQAQPVS